MNSNNTPCIDTKISHNERCRKQMKELYYKDIDNSRIIKSLNYYKRKFRDDEKTYSIFNNDKFSNADKLKEIKKYNFLLKLQML